MTGATDRRSNERRPGHLLAVGACGASDGASACEGSRCEGMLREHLGMPLSASECLRWHRPDRYGALQRTARYGAFQPSSSQSQIHRQTLTRRVRVAEEVLRGCEAAESAHLMRHAISG